MLVDGGSIEWTGALHRMCSISDSENPLKRIEHAPPSPTGFSLFCISGCVIH